MAHPGMLYMRLWQVAIPLVAALVGVVAGLSPQIGLAAGIAAVFVALVFADLALGLVLFILVAFLEGLAGFGGLSLPKAVGLLLVASWAASRLRDDAAKRELTHDHPVLVAALLAFCAWVTMSAVWAEQPGTALGSAMRWGPNLALFAIVYSAIRRREHVRWLFAAYIVGALLSGVAGVAMGGGGEEAGERLVGAGLNPNELGALLAVAVILAGSLAACRDLSPTARALAVAGAGLCVVALLMTVSRGALLGLGASLLVAPLLVGPRRRFTAAALAAVALAFTVSYAAYFAPEAVVERLLEADSSGSGRTDIWKVGWRIVEDRPLLGVGADNFPNSTIHYLLEPGVIPNSDFIVDTPKVAHNIYLQVQAELGAIGSALFLFIVGFAFVSALRAARAFERRGDRSMEILARGLLIGLAGWFAAAFFSSAMYSKPTWLMLGLCVALGALSRADQPARR